MANEIVYTGLSDQRLAEVLSGELLMQLAARESLPSHPALFYGGDAMGKGSIVVKVPIVGLMGYDAMASVGETAAIGNTPLTDTSVLVSVGRFGKAYSASDMAKFTAPMAGGIQFNAALFAQDAIASDANQFVDLIAQLVGDFSATVGTTTVDADLAVHMAAQDTLEIANVPQPWMALYHARQWRDIVADIALGVGGTVQYVLASEQLIAARGSGYKGMLLGTDVFSSTQVPTANGGADRAGGMFGRGAIAWVDSTISIEGGDPNQLLIGGKLLLERERTARAALTAYVSQLYRGASLAINAAGVSVITDA